MVERTVEEYEVETARLLGHDGSAADPLHAAFSDFIPLRRVDVSLNRVAQVHATVQAHATPLTGPSRPRFGLRAHALPSAQGPAPACPPAPWHSVLHHPTVSAASDLPRSLSVAGYNWAPFDLGTLFLYSEIEWGSQNPLELSSWLYYCQLDIIFNTIRSAQNKPGAI